jgi:hypothetical protein
MSDKTNKSQAGTTDSKTVTTSTTTTTTTMLPGLENTQIINSQPLMVKENSSYTKR